MADNQEIEQFLSRPISALPQIGTVAETKLNKLQIYTIEDLLHHYPFRYDDLSLHQSIAHVQTGETVTLQGYFQSLTNVYLRSGKTLQKGVFTDNSGEINVTWFNQPYLIKSLSRNTYVSLSGKVSFYRSRPTLTSPRFEIIPPSNLNQQALIHTGRLVPIYHETSGISSKWLRRHISLLLKFLTDIPEWLPPQFLKEYQLVDLKEALSQIHYPASAAQLAQAQNRLKFEEMLVIQLQARLKRLALNQETGIKYQCPPAAKNAFLEALPFKLTDSQIKALLDLDQDLTSGHPMNRLLQGDVGSGKTVVAAYALYLTALNHHQAVLMAPTEILALQHFETLLPIFKRLNLPINLITQNHSHSEPNACIHLGTQALLYRTLPSTLGLIIIDEQHKFGVNQRMALTKKQLPWPHIMVMTATPIPRTLSLTLYADLSLTNLTHKPFTTNVKTKIVYPPQKLKAYEFIYQRIKHKGDQVFVVCPFIDDSTNQELATVKAVQTVFQELTTQVYPDLKIGLLHGRQKANLKLKTIQAFSQHKLDILVSTPIVEVGVDIPHASIMWIESGERFGLASLHQLRGRVGRQGQTAYCFVFAGNKLSAKSRTRLEALETLDSGFALAEADLKLRGPGDLYGTAQSGFFKLKLASLYDLDLIRQTQIASHKLLSEYPAFLPLSHKLKSLLKYPVYGRTT